MRSIRRKLTLLILSAALICTAVTAGFGLWTISRLQQQSSEQILTLTCQQQAGKLNQSLINIEGSVEACGELVTSKLGALNGPDDEGYDFALQDMERFVSSIAQNTSGVCTYYLRIVRHPGEEPEGFFYTRRTLEAPLTKEPVTHILDYDPSDVEHVGWYYQPAQAQHPIWMAPYHNQNIDLYMVSYVVPLYVDGNFVGVIGMDLNFSIIVDAIRQIKPYKTGEAFLVSDDGLIQYHASHKAGTKLAEIAPELGDLVDRFADLEDDEAGTCSYAIDGVSKQLGYCGLRNDMVLMLAVETSEVNTPAINLLSRVALTGLALMALMAFVVVRVSNRITGPLLQLADAADRIAQGDLDVRLPEPTNDEVGMLTRSFDVTVQSLRAYISGMHDKAYRDALTMVKNKAAYDEATQELDQQVQSGEAEFALLMLDVNYLKAINDRHGHEQGDDYLRTCCQMACHVFDHSPVFRIGGDEFVVLLRGDEYRRRDELMAELRSRMDASQGASEPWHRVSMAMGIGVYAAGDPDADAVLRRADKAMYDNKCEMKAGR